MNNIVNALRSGKRKNKIKFLLGERITGIQLFLTAFAIFLVSENLTTTMFSVPGKIHLLCKGLAFLLIIIKIFLFDQYRPKEFWAMAVSLAIGIAIIAASGYTEPLMWLIMLWGAKDVPWRKILQVFLIVAVTILVVSFCASMLDVIENLQYAKEDGKRLRNSFGSMYTTDFASHIFSIFLAGFYLLKDRLRLWHCVCCMVIAGLVFWFCNTRLDVGCTLLLVVVFAGLNIWNRKPHLEEKYCAQEKNTRKWVWFMPFTAAVMYMVTMLYTDKLGIMVKLNTVLSNRLELGKTALNRYGYSPFGQYVEMVGNGGSTIQMKEYFFVDCSYLYVALRYGLVFLLIALAVYVLCCRKFRKDYYFLAAIVLISINCMIAHHMIELAYNPFALALFAGIAENIGTNQGRLCWKRRYSGADSWREANAKRTVRKI